MSKNNNDAKLRVKFEEDFINYPKFSNSLKKLISKYPDGVEDEVIAKALILSKEEVKARYESYIKLTREMLGVSDGDKN
jgi:hypothetical protein